MPGAGRRVWVDGGYVEIQDGDGDIWGVDVELVEHVAVREAEDVVQRPLPVGSGAVRIDTEFSLAVVKTDDQLK